MSERGKALYKLISTGSNTAVKAAPGTLYRVLSSNPSGSIIRVENGDLGTTPNYNTTDTDTIWLGGGATIDFGPGVGFDLLNVAATSNARLTVVFE